jgi:hypothetical protein
MLAIRGLSLIVAAVLATVIALGWIDYRVRFSDRGVLVVFAAMVLAVFAWTGCLAVRRFLTTRLGEIDVALHVEACFPEVKDRLASAVEFLRQPQDDALAGSAAMRRAAISQATAASENLDFGAALDRRPAVRAALAAVAVGGLAVCLTLAYTAAARTALARLVFPLGTADWPQRTHLGLRRPVKTLVRGQELVVAVIDTEDAPLPSDCQVHYRLKDAQGRTKEETGPMQLRDNAAVARRENVTSPLEFCCTGGDDQKMIWNAVQVVDPPEPPAVRTLALKITPPGYTNWPEEDRDAMSPRPLLAGSRVQLSGTATKRLKPTSKLRFDDGHALPLEIEDNGVTFHAGSARSEELIVDKSTGYTLHLVDIDGVEGGNDQHWQLRVRDDDAPSAIIELPAGDCFVTDKAVVKFRVRARDDLALREVKLTIGSSDRHHVKERTLTLWQGPEEPPRSSLSVFDSASAGEQETFDPSPLHLSEFRPTPGMQLTCYATATDYHNQTGRSDPRIVTIITQDQLLERMAVRQNQIVAELARVLQLQRDAAGTVRTSAIRLHETAGLDQADVDRLQNAEFNQREVARSLTSSADGLPVQVRGLLSDLETNRVDSPDLQRRVERLLAEFNRLGREELPVISSRLTAAIKGSQIRLQSLPRPAGNDAESESHLTTAGQHQQHVIAALEAMLAGMRQWDDYRRFHREVAQLLRDQKAVSRNTTEMAGQTVGRDLKDLSPQESADLKILEERQLELTRRETRLEQEMEQTVAALGQGEPLAAGTLTDAVAEARRLAIAADMSAAGGKIHANGLGQASVDQQRILQNLQEVLDILTNNRRQELGRLAKKLAEAEKDIASLRQQQQGLRRNIEESAETKADLQRLARQQAELRQKTLQFGRRLERLMAEDAAGAAEKAAQLMGEGARAAETGDRKGAAGGARKAEDRLANTARRLRDKRIEVEAGLAMEEQARLHDTLERLQLQEQQIADQTRGFAELENRGGLDRTQIDSLLRLAHQQELLRDEADRTAQALEATNVFRAALSRPVEDMGRSAGLLQRRQTGSATQEAEKSAIDRLKMLLAAVESETKGELGKDDQPPGGQGGNGQDAEPPSGVLPLAQVTLVKLLQEDLNLRTQRLNQAEAAGKPNEEAREQYSRLLEEQGYLAELTIQLLRPQSPDNGEQPDDAGEPKEKLP